MRPDAPATTTPPVAVAVENPRQYFLRDRALPDGTWLLLAPAAFRDGVPSDSDPAFRVVRDTALLRDAAAGVWFDNDDSKRAKHLFWSIVFMSPPTGSRDADFALLRGPDGAVENVSYYYPSVQQQDGPPRELGPLLAASEPVIEQVEGISTRAEYAALVARIAAGGDLFTLGPLPAPDPQLGFAGKVLLRFPSLILPTDQMTDARLADEIAKASALFTATFGPPGESYTPLDLRPAPCETPYVGNVENDVPVLINDAILEFPGYATLTLEDWVDADAALLDRIAAEGAVFGAARQPPEMTPAVDALITRKLGAVSTDDYALIISCFNAQLDAGYVAENKQYLTYYQIVTDRVP